MRTLNHAALELYISTARLDTYRAFFAPADSVELFGCYLWSKEVAAAFLPILQVLEVGLRNSIHNEAKARAALGPYWFDHLATQPLNKQDDSQKSAAAQAINAIKSARDDIRRDLGIPKSTSIPEDKIVAKTTFGYWCTLFNPVFEVNRNPKALWPALLRPVFPNAPKGYRDRAIIQQKLQAVKTFRNRAFHHEPVWNIGRPATIADSIKKLHDTKDEILTLIRWISSDCAELVNRAGYVHGINRVCSVEHLQYLQNPGSNERPVSIVKRELRGLLRNAANNTTDITVKGSRVGKLVGS